MRFLGLLKSLFSRSCLAACGPLFLATSVASHAAVSAQIPAEQLQFFESKVRPIFANHCLECHSQEKGKVKGGLNMDSREDLLHGGESGVVLKPGDAKGSNMIRAVEWTDDLQMPPKKRLSDEQIAVLKQWVNMGAPDPRDGKGGKRVTKKDHWSFQPVSRPAPPKVQNAGWCKTSIDRFVLAKLEEMEMLPADPPDSGNDEERRRKREALLRRAYFDLIGMPPNPSQIRAFTNDNAPNAFEKVIDELLASPAYGERWARHWLDTARYSDTTGLLNNDRGMDYRYSYAWGYRDWVIRAINSDMPYDQFIINQLAADKVPDNPKENLAALGFLTVGQRFNNRDDILNDRIDAVGRGFLGLTVACARCHDHKFDPVTQADYYALKGVFQSIAEPTEGPIISGDPNSKEYQEFSKKLEGLEKEALATVFEMQREVSDKFREKAGAYFHAAFELRDRNDVEAKKRADEVVEKNKLDARFINDHLLRRINPADPLVGPFVKLLLVKENRERALADLLAGKTREKYNSEVLGFLSKAGSLPDDLEMVGALFEKMFREKVEPVAGQRPSRKGDSVTELQRGGIHREIGNPATDFSKANKPLMELAAFPLRLVTSERVKVYSDLRNIVREWGLVLGGQLENRSGLTKINELPLRFRGGPVRAMVVEDLPKPVNSPIYPRGNAPKRGEEVKIVPRRFIEVLSPEVRPFNEGSGRLELALAIASKSNPLAARVLVNRSWMYFFGEGLVRTPDDLGNQAGKPSHPELLDYLSSWFMDDMGSRKPAWSVKALHKAIMLSSVYQQSSRTLHLATQKGKDPSNALLWRANVRRLDFEAFRDSLLAMSNSMEKTLYGPPVNLVSEPYSFRRSVYGYVDRSNVPDLLNQFDMASALEPNTKRTSTIVPQQALFLMNSPFTISVVQRVVQRPEVVEAVKKDARSGILAVFQIVLQRTPTKAEFDMAAQFLIQEAKTQAETQQASAQINLDGEKRAQQRLQQDRRAEANKRGALLNEGDLVKRVTLSPWETLVQALMFCNEAAYLN